VAKATKSSWRSMVTAVKSIEMKNFDVISGAAATVAALTWSAPALLNNIIQGDTANTRTGRRVTMTRLHVKGGIQGGSSDCSSSSRDNVEVLHFNRFDSSYH